DSSDAGLSLDLIERSGATVSASEVWTPTRARREWARLFPGADARVGTFLVGLLTVNCAPDPETTRRWHERRIEMIYAVDRYEAGAVLVRKGQIVDEKAARALREMSWRRRDEEPKPIEPVRTTPAPAPGPVLVRVAAPSQTERKRDFLGPAVVLVVVAGVSATMGLGWVSRRRSGSAIPQSRSAVLIMDDGETSWRGRALAAERRAERLGAVVKAGLAPILGHQFVQTLVAERSRMQEARRLAEEDVAELERRLDALHAPLTARLRAYEERIAELERELAARDKENSELLRTRVALTREKLAAAARGAR
ncbi:MAG TPA: hypothetical protein VNO52_01055, partial [Methylomirabilota bacterium]|nr:hypothetical protein [Methylomirabilota bacterium]